MKNYGFQSRLKFLAEEKEYKTDWLFARSEPFPVCTVNDFLASPPHSIQELEDQMVKHLTLNPKKNDLYQFSQSDEIMKMRNGILMHKIDLKWTLSLNPQKAKRIWLICLVCLNL